MPNIMILAQVVSPDILFKGFHRITKHMSKKGRKRDITLH